MEKINDLQICGCVMLKYALSTRQTELFTALFMTLLSESGMDFDSILNVMEDVNITQNKTSFTFTGELGKLAVKKMHAMLVSNN